jgi:hypothetical protein
MANVLVVNSGYRTRYPHVVVATNCPTGREDGRPLKAGKAEAIDIRLRQINLGYYFHTRPENARASEI